MLNCAPASLNPGYATDCMSIITMQVLYSTPVYSVQSKYDTCKDEILGINFTVHACVNEELIS